MKMIRLSATHYVPAWRISEISVNGQEGDFRVMVRLGDDKDMLIYRRVRDLGRAENVISELVSELEKEDEQEIKVRARLS